MKEVLSYSLEIQNFFIGRICLVFILPEFFLPWLLRRLTLPESPSYVALGKL